MLELCDDELCKSVGMRPGSWWTRDGSTSANLSAIHYNGAYPSLCVAAAQTFLAFYGMTELDVTISMGIGKRVMSGMLVDERIYALRRDKAEKA